ncbi:hypothetical protein [Yinghuangia seranimata]|uniref:hypothetical protein n=1 Tax=Yinghuangia seranimata TaxID=408067 RepID=UPI00248CA811|nr:hypothetical protein [Yinghuangia seranimata]MDI2129966.1 hypothetical protein [Yinghuangia seranimata]MDI2131644.1 hypothetical protein [Yinghuangia seranimata]
MYSSPGEGADPLRVLDALDQAADVLGVVSDGEVVWGFSSRMVSRRVRYGRRAAWLRVLEASASGARGRLWEGNEAAEKAFGDLAGVRPALLNLFDWAEGGAAFRAELIAYVDEPVCSASARAPEGFDPGPRWWSTLRSALETVGRARTERVTVRQDWVDRAVPRFVGVAAPRIGGMVPAHGDLHWASVTRHGPHIVDWEAWGLAPVGFDAAMLHTYALLHPDVAARVRREFPVLDSAAGRVAETVVLAQLLERVSEGLDLDLADALRERVAAVCGRL